MTRTEWIQKRMKPLVETMKPFVHEEDRPKLEAAVEIFLLRLVLDFSNLSSTDISELSEKDFGDYGETLL